MAKTTTTTTTTTNTTVTTTISLNTSYMCPHGILKIIEIIVCIIVFACVASRVAYTKGAAYSMGDNGYYDGPQYGLAVGVIFFITTLILLILFLFNIVQKLGGSKIWFMIDTVLNVLAVILFLIAAIVLFVYCSGTYRFGNRDYSFTITNIIVAGVFSIIAAILYILSIVFAMKAGQAPMISVKA